MMEEVVCVCCKQEQEKAGKPSRNLIGIRLECVKDKDTLMYLCSHCDEHVLQAREANLNRAS